MPQLDKQPIAPDEWQLLAEAVTKLGFGKYVKILLSKWNSHAHVSGLHTATRSDFAAERVLNFARRVS